MKDSSLRPRTPTRDERAAAARLWLPMQLSQAAAAQPSDTQLPSGCSQDHPSHLLSDLCTHKRCCLQPPEPAECCVVKQPQHHHDAPSSLGGKQQPKVGLKTFIFNHRRLLQPLLTASKHGAFWSTQTAHPCDRTGDYTGGCFCCCWLRTDL